MTLVAISGMIAAATPHAQGAVTWAAGAPGGSSGGSLDFDGSSFLGTSAASANLGPSYTASMWINADINNQQWFFGTGAQGLHLGVRDGGGAQETLSQGHWGNDSDGTTTIASGTWYHATFTYDGTDQRIYLNGNLEATTAKGPSNNTSTDLIIGGRNGGGSWNGKIDDVAIWDSVLTDAQISDLHDGTQGSIALGAQAYWDFEDAQTGTTAGVSGTGLGAGLGAAALTGIVPEPSSIAFVLVGAAGLLRRKRA